MQAILTPIQVDTIRNIVKNAGATYYDVEVELTDHICNMVEQLMLRNKNIAFEEALNQALHVFEPEGLSNLIQKRIKKNKTILTERNIMQTFFKAFRLPHLLLTIAFVMFYTYFFVYHKTNFLVIKSMFMTIGIVTAIGNAIVLYLYNNQVKTLALRFSTLGLKRKLYFQLILIPLMHSFIIYNSYFKYRTSSHIGGIQDNYTAQYIALAIIQCMVIIFSISCFSTYFNQIKKIQKQFPYAFK